jgi:hypothetical protein
LSSCDLVEILFPTPDLAPANQSIPELGCAASHILGCLISCSYLFWGSLESIMLSDWHIW